MKPLFYLPRAILIFSAFSLMGLLSACGQIGPLYMPKVPADPDAPKVVAPPPTTTPAPDMSPMPPGVPRLR